MAGVFVQQAPDVADAAKLSGSASSGDLKPMAGVTPTGQGTAAPSSSTPTGFVAGGVLKSTELPGLGASGVSAAAAASASIQTMREDVDNMLLWLSRFPLSSNNPRATTGALPTATVRRGVVCLQSTDTISAAFTTLTVEGYLGAPVITRSGRYIGTIDMLDLVNFALQLFDQSAYERSAKGWSTFFDEEKQFRTTIVRALLKAKEAQPVHTALSSQYACMQGFSTMHPLEVLARSKTVRRVPIIDSDAKVCGMVTQSMMISLLQQNEARLGAMRHIKLRDVDPSLVPSVLSVRSSEKAAIAFRRMADNGMSGLAMVDEQGYLVDAITVRDLRGIGTSGEKFHRLSYDCTFYKDLVKSEFARQTPSSPVWVTGEATLGEVLRLMDDGNIHRVFVCTRDVVNAKPLPYAVIAQRDFLLIILKLLGL